jgi:c(7)-type cytochrome triheme protein
MGTPASSVFTASVALLLAAAFGAGPLLATEPSLELRLPPDVAYSGADASPGPVVFSHVTHVPLAGMRCVECHPARFSILGPTRGLTHEEMNAGEKCGGCHDGNKASGVQDDCTRCHKMEGGP